MEQYRYKEATLENLKLLLMEDEFRSRTDIGITLQAYLRDSYADLKGIIDWAKRKGKSGHGSLGERRLLGSRDDYRSAKPLANASV